MKTLILSSLSTLSNVIFTGGQKRLYYQLLGIKEDYEIWLDLDNNYRTKKNELSSLIRKECKGSPRFKELILEEAWLEEAYSVLSSLKLRETYISFVECGKERCFLDLIGFQFRYFFSRFYHPHLYPWDDKSFQKSREYLQEKVLKIALRLRDQLNLCGELQEEETKTLFINFFVQESEAFFPIKFRKDIQNLNDKFTLNKENYNFYQEVNQVFFYRAKLGMLRSLAFISKHDGYKLSIDSIIIELISLRNFINNWNLYPYHLINEFYNRELLSIPVKGDCLSVEHSITYFLEIAKQLDPYLRFERFLYVSCEKDLILELVNIDFNHENSWESVFIFYSTLARGIGVAPYEEAVSENGGIWKCIGTHGVQKQEQLPFIIIAIISIFFVTFLIIFIINVLKKKEEKTPIVGKGQKTYPKAQNGKNYS